MTVLRRSPLSRIFTLRRSLSTRPAGKVTIGVRREDPARIWERRCPITPEAVEHLVQKEDVKVLIQDCDRRVFPITDYVKAGAQIHPTLEPAHIIMGIKETPLDELVSSPVPSPLSSAKLVPRTHLMFSHTTKGQPYNMELLSRFLRHGTSEYDSAKEQEKGLEARLIDYELLAGKDGKRTVGFGWFAGVAGALESLSAMAHAHLEIGVASPFLHTPRPHTHPTIPSLRTKLREVGEAIGNHGTPRALGPLVICVTGSGKVSQGALDILKELPIEKVDVENLPALISDPNADLRKVYLVHALPSDYLTRTDGGKYERQDYYANPDKYQSVFHEKLAPYLTLFINGAGWAPSFPRLLTNGQLVSALGRAKEVGKGRFSSIGDISCDIGGGLEFLTHSSTLSEPYYSIRQSSIPDSLPTVQMMAVDILPTALPLDASKHFSNALSPYLMSLIREYKGETDQGGYREALKNATVATAGELTVRHTWLEEPLGAWRERLAKTTEGPIDTSSSEALSSALYVDKALKTIGSVPKKVLMLGSGMVAGPAVDEICKRSDIELLVASNSKIEADRLVGHHENATALLVDITDRESVERLVAESDIVISLLPVPFHPSIAEICVQNRKHLVTASYISPAMKEWHERAEAADVLLLNEIGLDPGIDHCSAISLLSDLRAQNKRVVSFTSFCGGLPAAESANVPLGYKFSWSPRGVLGAALNSARFKLNGKDWEIPGESILQSRFPEVPVPGLTLEGIANRDSLPYASAYDLGPVQDLRTLLRGTLRYPGFSELMHWFKFIGLLEDSKPIQLDDWASLARKSMEERHGIKIPSDAASVQSAISSLVPSSQMDSVKNALDWLSLTPGTSSSIPLPSLPKKPTAPIDLFTMILARKLRYEPDEKDLVVLSHEIVTQSLSDPTLEEVHSSSLVTYGDAKASAMARCVGLPVAFAALEILDGKVQVRGVQGPTDKSVYRAVLNGLEEVGLGMKESSRKGKGMEELLAKGLTSR